MTRSNRKHPRPTSRILPAVLIGAALALATGSARPGGITLHSHASAGADRGITRVLCDRGPKRVSRMRAIVLDVGVSPRRDVLLTPAHGLPADAARITTECRILDSDGSPRQIARFWRGRPDGNRLENDWAVLVTQTPLAGQFGRLRAGVVAPANLERYVEDGGTVDVLLARAAADLRACRIISMRDRKVFRHSCRAWPGLSGSPIVIGLDGEPVVVGITIARDMRPTDVDGPLFIGVGLTVHGAIAEAIAEATAAAEAP